MVFVPDGCFNSDNLAFAESAFMIRSVRSDIEIFAKENVFIKDEFYIAISGKKKKPLFCPMLTLNIKSTNLTANLCENIKIRFSGTFTKPLIRQCNSLTQHCGQLDIVCKTVKFTICSAYFPSDQD